MVVEIILGIVALILVIVGIAQIKFVRKPSKVNIDAALYEAGYLDQLLYTTSSAKDPNYFLKGTGYVLERIKRSSSLLQNALQYIRYSRFRVNKELQRMYQKYMGEFNRSIARPVIDKIYELTRKEGYISTLMNKAGLISVFFEGYGRGVLTPQEVQENARNVIKHYREEAALTRKANEVRTKMMQT